MSLVSLASFKEYLPENQGTGSDSDLQSLLDRAESAVAAYLGYPRVAAAAPATNGPKLSSGPYTFYIDGPVYGLSYVLPLPARPVTAITSWHSDVLRVHGSDTEIAADQFDLDTTLGRLILKSTATSTIDNAYRANKVVCTAGFTTAPDDLEHAVCVYASALTRSKASQGKESTNQRDSSVKFSPRSLPPEVVQIINNYRVFGRIL